MAEAVRLLVSDISAMQTRATPNPMRNYRPVFESIILSSSSSLLDRNVVPERLATALDGLLQSAQSKGVEEQVNGILRMYASEIRNDIVILTINRLQELVNKTPSSSLPSRLEQCSNLMREFQHAADTIPALMANMGIAMGGDFDRLQMKDLKEMVSKSLCESQDCCPTNVSRTMRTKIKLGHFDHIAPVAEIRDRLDEIPMLRTGDIQRKDGRETGSVITFTQFSEPVNDNASSSIRETPQGIESRRNIMGAEMLKSIYVSPERIWCDEVGSKRKVDDEPKLVFDSVASVMRKQRGGDATYSKGGRNEQQVAPIPVFVKPSSSKTSGKRIQEHPQIQEKKAKASIPKEDPTATYKSNNVGNPQVMPSVLTPEAEKGPARLQNTQTVHKKQGLPKAGKKRNRIILEPPVKMGAIRLTRANDLKRKDSMIVFALRRIATKTAKALEVSKVGKKKAKQKIVETPAKKLKIVGKNIKRVKEKLKAVVSRASQKTQKHGIKERNKKAGRRHEKKTKTVVGEDKKRTLETSNNLIKNALSLARNENPIQRTKRKSRQQSKNKKNGVSFHIIREGKQLVIGLRNSF